MVKRKASHEYNRVINSRITLIRRTLLFLFLTFVLQAQASTARFSPSRQVSSIATPALSPTHGLPANIDHQMIEKINGILNNWYDSKTFRFSNPEVEKETFRNCDDSKKSRIDQRMVSAKQLIKTWLEKIVSYEKSGAIPRESSGGWFGSNSSSSRSELAPVVETLQCVLSQFELVNFECKDGPPYCDKRQENDPFSDIRAGNNGDAYAYITLDTAPKDIYLCNKNFWHGSLRETAVIIHELSHACGTNDAAYFRHKKNTPKDVFFTAWSNIASTYEYWGTFGFCVPGIDCSEK